jgi:hypothetical protein
MSLSIEYNDSPDLTIYALLFSSTDKTKAFNPTRNQFLTFTLATQSNFAIKLIEGEQRVGFYRFAIEDVSSITATTQADEFYLLEVYRLKGDSYDRRTDKLVGTKDFFWDGEKEITLKELADLIAEKCDTPTGALPNVQVPRLGPKGSNAGTGGITFSRNNGA